MVVKKGGKKGKKGKKPTTEIVTRELVFKDVEQSQEYAQVIRLLGSCRCELSCV